MVSLHKINRHVLQVWLWLLGLSLAIFLVLGLALQHPRIQGYAAQQLTGLLTRKFQTKVFIRSFSTDWKNHIALEDFYLEDQQQDTLLFARRIGVNINVFALIWRQVSIRDVTLDRAVFKVRASVADSVYNYDFIRKAFLTPDAPAADSTLSFSYKFGDLRLDHVRLQIQDSIRGNFIVAQVGHFRVRKDWFKRNPKALKSTTVALDSTVIRFRQTKIPESPADTLALDIRFNEIKLNSVKLMYVNEIAAQHLDLSIGNSEIRADTFDLKSARIQLAHLQVNNSSFAYFQGKKTTPDSSAIRPARTIAKIDQAVAQATRDPQSGWLVSIHQVNFRNINLAYGNYQTPLPPGSLDINHLKLTHLNFDLNSFLYHRQKMSARMQDLSFRDTSGFRVIKFGGSIQTRPNQVLVQNARIHTPISQIRGIRQFSYKWSKNNGHESNSFLLTGTFSPSVIHAIDWAYLKPYLPQDPPLKEIFRHTIRVQGQAAVTNAWIRADHLRLTGLTGTDFYFSGEVKGLTNRESTHLNLRVHQLITNRHDSGHLLPAGTLSPGMTMPSRLRLTGHFRGGGDALTLRQVRMKGSDGSSLEISGTIRNLQGSKKWFDLDIKQYQTSRNALLHLLPPKAISQDLQLPEKMDFAGSFQGASLKQFRTYTHIKSSYGQVLLDLVMRPGEQFSGSLQVSNFELGKFLEEEEILGLATAKATFTGQGLTFATTRVRFDASIQHIIYNRAPYKNIHLNGTLDKEVYDVQGSLAKIVIQKVGNKIKKLNPTKIRLPGLSPKKRRAVK